jgi:hypothetical protein
MISEVFEKERNHDVKLLIVTMGKKRRGEERGGDVMKNSEMNCTHRQLLLTGSPSS